MTYFRRVTITGYLGLEEREIYQFKPAERQVHADGFLDLEQVEEAPEQRQDEGGDDDKEEPVIVTHTPWFATEKMVLRSVNNVFRQLWRKSCKYWFPP